MSTTYTQSNLAAFQRIAFRMFQLGQVDEEDSEIYESSSCSGYEQCGVAEMGKYLTRASLMFLFKLLYTNCNSSKCYAH